MKQQRGGTLLGFIMGLVVGLGAALAVAVYVTKVPIPFVNKASTRTVEQDAAETQKNKEWDPNAPLYGKNPVKTAASAPIASAPAATDAAPVPGKDAAHQAEAAKSLAPAVAAKTDAKAADPLGELAKASVGKAAASAAAGADPFSYYVQLGAFRTPQDAEAQRAKWSLTGVQTQISEREQSGRMVYRVRAGPFEQRDEAEKLKQKLDATGAETALVRVQR
jgi:cell division protein FtsN